MLPVVAIFHHIHEKKKKTAQSLRQAKMKQNGRKEKDS